MRKVPLEELLAREARFREAMSRSEPDWELAVIVSKINQYYFTGTMQDGVIAVPRDGETVYWTRRSYERALDESLFPRIKPMGSFRDLAASGLRVPKTLHLEEEVVPLALSRRLQKHLPFQATKSLDARIAEVRAVKSPYELAVMERAGQIHRRVLEERLPAVLKEGMSEVDLAAATFAIMLEEGHYGVTRFGMFDTEMVLGQICFGESSLYPTSFNGPGGSYGMAPAVPLIGSRERKLKRGDLVFVDLGCCVEGYHTDKTMTYVFGGSLPPAAMDEHRKCVDIQNRVAAMLKPGAVPAEIYRSVMSELSPEFLKNFMGFGDRKVKFLGHGVGLLIDEWPVIAEGFSDPLREGMAFALEPKKGIAGVGMVGIENTFFVTASGGRIITGDHPGPMSVG